MLFDPTSWRSTLQTTHGTQAATHGALACCQLLGTLQVEDMPTSLSHADRTPNAELPQYVEYEACNTGH